MVYFSAFTLLLLWLHIKFRGASCKVSNLFSFVMLCAHCNIIIYMHLVNIIVIILGSTLLEVVAAELAGS